jgi:folate-binding protein YgfZ
LSPITNSTSNAVFRWKPTAWLRVSGSDAATFLQGQFTNDLTRADGVYGLWLNVKGKVLADSFVFARSATEEFWIGSYFSAARTIRERLESFIIADDVTVEDQTAEWTGLTVLDSDAARPEFLSADTAFEFAGRRGGEAREYVFPATLDPQAEAYFAGQRVLSAEEITLRRIEAAIPAVPQDIGPADLPNEGGLETAAISYTKGCYLGQEVMARLKSMGQVRRRLVRVRISADVPTLPAPLFVGSRQIGEVRSIARDASGARAGLAMISLLHASENGFALAPDAAPSVQIWG